MPYDLNSEHRPAAGDSLRDEVLELMARAAADPGLSDQAMRTALRHLVDRSLRPADTLWDQYRGGRPDTAGRVYARYGY
jgi:hypothetical protein